MRNPGITDFTSHLNYIDDINQFLKANQKLYTDSMFFIFDKSLNKHTETLLATDRLHITQYIHCMCAYMCVCTYTYKHIYIQVDLSYRNILKYMH